MQFTVTYRPTHKALYSGWPWFVKSSIKHHGGMSFKGLRSFLLDWMLCTVASFIRFKIQKMLSSAREYSGSKILSSSPSVESDL